MEARDLVPTWAELAKGVGELFIQESKMVLHALFDSIHHEPKPSESEHFITDSVDREV